MNHRISAKKLNRTSSHRKALFKNMATALITHESIKTTLPKAKALRPIVEKLVTKARDGSLASRRHLLSILNDNSVVNKLIADLGPKYSSRPGGYLRIIKAGFRYGDMAPMAYIQFVDSVGKAVDSIDVTEA
jgi:large subunit ribosomal protein L17